MGEFRVYSTLAYQIEPTVHDPDQREDIRQLANNNVDCYLDLAESRIVCAFEANSSHVSRSKQRFLAEYVADETEELLLGIPQRIEALEEDDSDGDWELIRESSNTVWGFESAQPRSLEDLGTDFGLELALEDLVEDGAKLDLGITGYPEAAVAVTYFASEIEGNQTIGVSSNGRTSAVRSAELVLKPGAAANFDPLNDRTASLIGKRINNQKSRIWDWFESAMHGELVELVGSDLSHWSLYDELGGLESALTGGTPESTDHFIRTEQAARIVELARALQQNEQPADERVSPKILDQSTRETLIEGVLEAVRDKQQAIERHAFECTLGVLHTDLSALESLDRPAEQSALERARSVLDVSPEEASDCDAPSSFTDHVVAYRESDLHRHEERERITEEIREEIDDRLDEIVANERGEFVDRFEQWLAELTDPDVTTNRATKLRNAESLLKNDSSRDEKGWVSATDDGSDEWDDIHGRDDGPSSVDDSNADESSLPELESLLEDVRTNEVLPDDEQSSLSEQFLEDVWEEKSEFRENEKERYRERLSEHVDAVVDAEGSIKERYNRLGTMKDLCSGASVPRSHTRLYEFVYDLMAVRSHELFSQDDVKEITADIESRIEDERDALVDRKRDLVVDGVENELDEALARLDEERSPDHTQLRDELETVRRYLNNEIREPEYPDRPYLQGIKRRIDEIDIRNSGADSILTQKKFREIRASLRNEIGSLLADAQEEIRQDKLESFKTAIDDPVSALRESSLGTAIKIELTDSLLEYHKRGSTSTEIRSVEELSDEQQDELADLHRQLSAFARDPEAEGEEVLDDARLRELSAHYETELSRLRDDLCSELADDLTEEVKRQYEEQMVLNPKTVPELTDTIETLEGLQREVKTLANNSHNTSQFLDGETVDQVKLIDSKYKDQFRKELLEFLQTKVEDLRDRSPAMIRDELMKKTAKVVDSDAATKEKLVALSKLEDILKHRDVDEVPIVNAGPLVEHRDELGSEGYNDNSDAIEYEQDQLYWNYKQSVQETVSQVFEKHAEEIEANTSVVADTFVDLVDDYQEGNALENTDSVQPAVEQLREIRELEDHLSDERHDELQTAVRDAANRYASEGSSDDGGSSTEDLSAGSDSGLLSGSGARSRRATIGVLLVAVVLLAVGGGIGAYATGGLNPGSAPNAGEELQLAGLNVHGAENGDLVVAGSVVGNVSELRLQVTGPNVSQNLTVPVDGGEFKHRFAKGESGSYIVELRVTGSQGEWISFTSNVVREASPDGPTLEVERPSTGSNVTSPIQVNATTTAENVTVSLLNGSGESVSNRKVPVRNGTVDVELNVTASGDHYLLVVAQGDGSTTELRRIRVGE